ncbi:MAG: GGDEF domain-containing protein [Alphaproteobacteria bacterium]
MKVTQTGPIRSVARIRSKREGQAYARADASQAAGDVASVMGIPEAELTPRVRAAITALMQEVASLRDELRQTRDRIGHLEELADKDALVPAINRRAFVRELSRVMSYAERYGTTHSLVYFDLNGMKQINDTYGHAAGDAALKHVAEVLEQSTRESDIVGRLGGDEFGVILAQVDENTATEKAASLAARIAAESVEWQGRHLRLTVAHGIVPIISGQDADTALQAADRAMYANKKQAAARARTPQSTRPNQAVRR